MAIEDAVQLARCVRDRPTIPAALETYERLRRTRVERIVAVGARWTSDKVDACHGSRVLDPTRSGRSSWTMRCA